MEINAENFDPKIHICKFGFELYDYATFNPIRYNIIGNLYEKEKFILPLKYDKIKEIEDVIWACYKDGVLMGVKTEPGD